MSEERAELQQRIQELSTRLRELRDETKVQAHLAKMDAEAAWSEDLAPRLAEIQERLEEAGKSLAQAAGEAEVQAHLGLREAADRWAPLQGQLEEIARELGGELKGSFDRSRLQAHLAKMDAEGVVGKGLETLRERLQSAREQVEAESHQIAESLEGALGKLRRAIEKAGEPAGDDEG